MHAIKSLDNQLEDDEEDFYDEDEVQDIDEETEEFDEVEEDEVDEVDDEEALIITLTKPSAKHGSKKWKKEIADMIAVIFEYYDESALGDDGLDTSTLEEVLDTVFEVVSEFNID